MRAEQATPFLLGVNQYVDGWQQTMFQITGCWAALLPLGCELSSLVLGSKPLFLLYVTV